MISSATSSCHFTICHFCLQKTCFSTYEAWSDEWISVLFQQRSISPSESVSPSLKLKVFSFSIGDCWCWNCILVWISWLITFSGLELSTLYSESNWLHGFKTISVLYNFRRRLSAGPVHCITHFTFKSDGFTMHLSLRPHFSLFVSIYLLMQG